MRLAFARPRLTQFDVSLSASRDSNTVPTWRGGPHHVRGLVESLKGGKPSFVLRIRMREKKKKKKKANSHRKCLSLLPKPRERESNTEFEREREGGIFVHLGSL
ncbi:hypothetical protein ACFX19_021824 [Malus domestica]